MVNADITAINANFKQRLGVIQEAVGDFAIFYGDTPFKTRQRTGSVYRQPVILRNEQGWTASGPSSNGSADNNASITMVLGDCQLEGYNLSGTTQISFEELARSASSEQVFETEPGLRMMSLRESGQNRLESILLYGQVGLATFAADVDVVTSATVRTLTFSNAEWAPGTWASAEGAQVEFYDANDAVVTGGGSTVFTVGVVNSAAKTVAFTAANSTLATNLSTALNTAGVKVYWYGFKGNEAPGLKKLLTATTTVNGIDPGSYGLWVGGYYNVAGKANLNAINQAIRIPVERTGVQKPYTLYLSCAAWADLMSNAAAQRRSDASYRVSQFQNGFKQLEFYSQNNNVIKVKAHPMVKNGDAFLIEEGNVIRIGATDMTFSLPGFPDDQLWVLSPTRDNYQLRCFSNQNLLIQQPAKCVYLNGITSGA